MQQVQLQARKTSYKRAGDWAHGFFLWPECGLKSEKARTNRALRRESGPAERPALRKHCLRDGDLRAEIHVLNRVEQLHAIL